MSMHLSLCKPPVLLLYYSTHVVFCLRSTQNLLGGTAFFCRGPARTPFFCRQKPGRKTEVRAKGQAVCSRKAFCSSPKPLLLPSGSLPPRLRAEPPPRGGREEKTIFFYFLFNFPRHRPYSRGVSRKQTPTEGGIPRCSSTLPTIPAAAGARHSAGRRRASRPVSYYALFE